MQSTIAKNHEMLALIQEWGFWHEIQVGAQKEYAMSKEEFDKVLPEYWKFMGLIAMGHTGLGMFSETIDTIWHAHILNTRRYEQFCMTIFGRMIHHAPNLNISEIEHRSFAPDCFEPDPKPTCREPDPGPSCKEPDPNPSCTEGNALSLSHMCTLEHFCNVYTTAYGEFPNDIWSFSHADGTVN